MSLQASPAMLSLLTIPSRQGEAVEPSDYYPDEYYRHPVDDPRPAEMGRRTAVAAHQQREEMTRHQGLGEHLHVRRAAHSDPAETGGWKA
jgi:hypothetical protein